MPMYRTNETAEPKMEEARKPKSQKSKEPKTQAANRNEADVR